MDDHKLEKLLGRYKAAAKAAAVPLPQANLHQNVWREIRLRKSTPVLSAIRSSEFLAWFRGRVGQVIAPAMALALIMSVGMTVMANQTTTHQHVRQALGLQVFSRQSSPLTQLAANP